MRNYTCNAGFNFQKYSQKYSKIVCAGWSEAQEGFQEEAASEFRSEGCVRGEIRLNKYLLNKEKKVLNVFLSLCLAFCVWHLYSKIVQ